MRRCVSGSRSILMGCLPDSMLPSGFCPSGDRRLSRRATAIDFALDGFVIGVERGTHQEECRDAPRHIGDMAGFLLGESAAQQYLFAIAEPLLDHLIAAEGVLPDGGRNVAPEGFAVEIDVVGGSAGQGGGELEWRVGARDGLALAGHGDAALAAMPPPGGEIEIARVGIEL